MRRIDSIFECDTKRWKRVPSNHPIFLEPNYHKFEYAMLFFSGLRTVELKDNVNIGTMDLRHRNNIYITTNNELFKKIVKKLKPLYSSIFVIKDLGINRYSKRNDDYVLREVVDGIFACVHHKSRSSILYTNNMQYIYDNLQDISKFYVHFMERINFPISHEITDLSSGLASFQEMKDILTHRLNGYYSTLKRYLSIDRLNELFNSNESFVSKLLYSWLMRLSENSIWTIHIDNHIVFRYNGIIIADEQYVSSGDDTVETVRLRYPYFIYDLELSYDFNGRLVYVLGKGYHPNRLTPNEKRINEENGICIGELKSREINLQDLADNNDYTTMKEYLIDVVNSLKTVNLASAFWQPKRELFLERFQRSYKSRQVVSDTTDNTQLTESA